MPKNDPWTLALQIFQRPAVGPFVPGAAEQKLQKKQLPLKNADNVRRVLISAVAPELVTKDCFANLRNVSPYSIRRCPILQQI